MDMVPGLLLSASVSLVNRRTDDMRMVRLLRSTKLAGILAGSGHPSVSRTLMPVHSAGLQRFSGDLSPAPWRSLTSMAWPMSGPNAPSAALMRALGPSALSWTRLAGQERRPSVGSAAVTENLSPAGQEGTSFASAHIAVHTEDRLPGHMHKALVRTACDGAIARRMLRDSTPIRGWKKARSEPQKKARRKASAVLLIALVPWSFASGSNVWKLRICWSRSSGAGDRGLPKRPCSGLISFQCPFTYFAC